MFQYVKPTGGQQGLMQRFREEFEELYSDIENEVEDSRGKSSCLTKLEEASFWLNKAITKND